MLRLDREVAAIASANPGSQTRIPGPRHLRRGRLHLQERSPPRKPAAAPRRYRGDRRTRHDRTVRGRSGAPRTRLFDGLGGQRSSGDTTSPLMSQSPGPTRHRGDAPGLRTRCPVGCPLARAGTGLGARCVREFCLAPRPHTTSLDASRQRNAQIQRRTHDSGGIAQTTPRIRSGPRGADQEVVSATNGNDAYRRTNAPSA